MKSKRIEITTPFIRLDALLKLAGLANTGGHAKMVIQNGEVRVNDEICMMRGKKLTPDDKVLYDGWEITVTQK